MGDGAERRGDDGGENGSVCEWGPLSVAVQETADTRLSIYAFPATVSAPATPRPPKRPGDTPGMQITDAAGRPRHPGHILH